MLMFKLTVHCFQGYVFKSLEKDINVKILDLRGGEG